MRLLLFRLAVFSGGLVAQVLRFFTDIGQLLHGLLLDEHGFGKPLDGQFPGSGAFNHFRADGGGDDSADEAPEALVVDVTHGNVFCWVQPALAACSRFFPGRVG